MLLYETSLVFFEWQLLLLLINELLGEHIILFKSGT